MLESISFQENDLECTSKPYKQDNLIRTGETVVYEGNAFKVTRVRPFLVIKSENRVVCGNLYKRINVPYNYECEGYPDILARPDCIHRE